jgi:hypothetical protein
MVWLGVVAGEVVAPGTIAVDDDAGGDGWKPAGGNMAIGPMGGMSVEPGEMSGTSPDTRSGGSVVSGGMGGTASVLSQPDFGGIGGALGGFVVVLYGSPSPVGVFTGSP